MTTKRFIYVILMGFVFFTTYFVTFIVAPLIAIGTQQGFMVFFYILVADTAWVLGTILG